MRAALLVLSLLVCGVPAQAQSFEAGGSLATSCIGSDGSFCSENGLATMGPYASVWLGDRLEVGARVVWLGMREFEGLVTIDDPARFRVGDRRRRVTQAEFIYHFRRGQRVRPMVGLGFGQYDDRERISCVAVGCEPFLTRIHLVPGMRKDSNEDGSIVTGVSVTATPRLRIRGGWRYHNPFRDELALSEIFVAAGYRF